MEYIALGAAAFVVGVLFDLATLREWRYVKPALGLTALLVWIFAVYGVVRTSARFLLPAGLSWLGWPLLVVATVLLVYSLFIEIPFRQTYAKTGKGSKLITTGTYALCRHPGVLWFGLLLIALILLSQATLLLVAAPVWLLADLLWVWVQDAYLFPAMFPGYRLYQEKTPMLLPTWKSAVECIRTLRA
jgi:protein-S-isoprenylcysteine O-methyltransferase Ste14